MASKNLSKTLEGGDQIADEEGPLMGKQIQV